MGDGDHRLGVGHRLDLGLEAPHPGDHLRERLGAVGPVVGIVGVRRHPLGPPARALLVEVELRVAVELAQLMDQRVDLDLQPGSLGDQGRGLGRPAHRARQQPASAGVGDSGGGLARLVQPALGQPVALGVGQREAVRRRV